MKQRFRLLFFLSFPTFLLFFSISIYAQKPQQDSVKKKKNYGEISINYGKAIFNQNNGGLDNIINEFSNSFNISIQYRNKIYKRFDYGVFIKNTSINDFPKNLTLNKVNLDQYVSDNNIGLKYYKQKNIISIGGNVFYKIANKPNFIWDIYTGLGFYLFNAKNYYYNSSYFAPNSAFIEYNDMINVNVNVGSNFIFIIKNHYLVGFNFDYFGTKTYSQPYTLSYYSETDVTNISNFTSNIFIGYKF